MFAATSTSSPKTTITDARPGAAERFRQARW
jgi:hypothetical protein